MKFSSLVNSYFDADSPSLRSEISLKIFQKKYLFDQDKRNESFRGSLIPGKIYSFLSVPSSSEGRKELFDQNPVGIYSSSTEGKISILNLNLIPPYYRSIIMERFYEKNFDTISKNIESLGSSQIPIESSIRSLSLFLQGTGFKSAMYTFSMENIRKVYVVDYSDWPILLYRSGEIKGEALNEIYRRYKSKLND